MADPTHPTHPTHVAPPVAHYENFPVASLLCPPALRPPIAAIYHFARTADDLADEGDASPQERLAQLHSYRQHLLQAAAGAPPLGPWAGVFGPLQHAMQQHALPLNLLQDLLDAFEQDVRMTAAGARYADDDALLDYCRRSANPVGRLLLHLYGVADEGSLAHSDAICSALQLINFWQDLSRDIPRRRWYPSLATMARFAVTDADLHPASHSPNAIQMIAYYATTARASMLKGSKLVHRVPGRAGWELRLVVQGGLRILDKIEALGWRTWQTRPAITAADAPLLLWRTLWM
jgi:squalene synthase HpnC